MSIEQKEARRLELNAIVANNQRIKLGLSKKNWKKLKIFQAEYKKKISNTMADFYTDIATLGLNLDGDGTTDVFDRFNSNWKRWAHWRVNTLGLHNKEGKEEIVNKFEEFVDKNLNEAAAKIKKEQKETKEMFDKDITLKLITEALELGATKEGIDISTCKTYMDIVATLKNAVPRGGKTKFEYIAKDMLKKHGLL